MESSKVVVTAVVTAAARHSYEFPAVPSLSGALIALLYLLLLLQLEAADSWEGAVDEVMAHFELEHQRRATYTICYY